VTASPQVAVLLYEPQDPINIGSVVRACNNCGCDDLRLLRPRTAEARAVLISAPHGEAFFRASVTIHHEWEPAAEGLHRVIAVSGRSHATRTPVMTLDAAFTMLEQAPEHRVGFVFGREDAGLPNHVVDRCDAVVTLEAVEEHYSYNLAQAVLLVLHRAMLRWPHGEGAVLRAALRAASLAKPRTSTSGSRERYMGEVERMLDQIGFFKGDQRENVVRTLRHLIRKADPDEQELATLWGILSQVERVAPGPG